MSFKNDFNLFVGSDNGILKGINLRSTEPIIKNIHNLKVLEPVKHGITAMSWDATTNERDILMGLKNQTVKVYDTDFKAFITSIQEEFGEGAITGILKYDDFLVTAVESGVIKFWKYKCSEQKDILARDTLALLKSGDLVYKGKTKKTGWHVSKERTLDCMVQCPTNPHIIAAGGRENGLKLFSLEKNLECCFQSKNVAPDFLQLRVPIWVSGITFLDETPKIATCSRYGHVRLYDPRKQRRPVMSMETPDEAPTCIATAPRPDHIVVGTGKGRIMLMDLRRKGSVIHTYKGAVGGIRDMKCQNSGPCIISVSLDRHLRVHDLNTRALISQVFLKSKLNRVLVRSDFTLHEDNLDTEKNKLQESEDKNFACENEEDELESIESEDSFCNNEEKELEDVHCRLNETDVIDLVSDTDDVAEMDEDKSVEEKDTVVEEVANVVHIEENFVNPKKENPKELSRKEKNHDFLGLTRKQKKLRKRRMVNKLKSKLKKGLKVM